MKVLTEKNSQHECYELSFIWEKNEDYNLGGSISNNFEKLIQRNRAGDQCYILFYWRGV